MAASLSGRSKRAVAERPRTARRPSTARDAQADGDGTREASVHEAKTHLSRLLSEVETGQTVIITRRGKPVAKLEALSDRPKRVFGSMKGRFTLDDVFFDPLPDDELKAWEG